MCHLPFWEFLGILVWRSLWVFLCHEKRNCPLLLAARMSLTSALWTRYLGCGWVHLQLQPHLWWFEWEYAPQAQISESLVPCWWHCLGTVWKDCGTFMRVVPCWRKNITGRRLWVFIYFPSSCSFPLFWAYGSRCELLASCSYCRDSCLLLCP